MVTELSIPPLSGAHTTDELLDWLSLNGRGLHLVWEGDAVTWRASWESGNGEVFTSAGEDPQAAVRQSILKSRLFAVESLSQRRLRN